MDSIVITDRKLLSFNFPNEESNHWVVQIQDCAANAGWQVLWCDYFGNQLFPIEQLEQRGFTYTVLLDRGMESAPRLTQRQYVSLCGDDIDFLRIASHEYVSCGYPVDENYLSPESIYRQKLRGIAHRIEQLLAIWQPDFVLAPQGAHVLSKLVVAKCLKMGIRVAVRESPFFQGYCLIDTGGMHFFSGESEIALRWPQFANMPLTADERRSVEFFIDRWKTAKCSKYPQPDQDEQTKSTLAAIQEARGEGRQILFYPGQVSRDASVLYGLGCYRSLDEFEDHLLESLPDDYCLVYKRHPFASPSQLCQSERVIPCHLASVHDLLLLCDAVAVFSSNVGLEALLFGRPVLCGGRPHYAGKGMTWDIHQKSDLSSHFQSIRMHLFNAELRNRYVHYLINDYLFHESDGQGFARKYQQACESLPAADRRAPLIGAHNRELESYFQMASRYAELANENLVHDEVLARMGEDTGLRASAVPSEKAASLKSGERQWGINFQDIERGHLARYDFAKKILDACSLPNEHSNSGKRKHVLDIACGVGYGSFMLASQTDVKVSAVDASFEAIEFAKTHWNHTHIEYVHQSCGSFFEKHAQCYDMIVCLETIEHLVNPERFLEHCWDHLRPDGVILLSVPHANVFPLLDTQFHVQHFTKASLGRLLGRLSPKYVQVLGQHKTRIRQELDSSKFLLGIAAKSDIGTRLSHVLPYELQNVSERAVFRVPHQLFSSPIGTFTDQGILLPANANHGYAFFGPYLAFPAGEYKVRYHFSEDRLPGPKTRLDVAYATGQVLTYKYGTNRVPNDLTFVHHDAESKLEFRGVIEGVGRAESTRFLGVTLEKLDSGKPSPVVCDGGIAKPEESSSPTTRDRASRSEADGRKMIAASELSSFQPVSGNQQSSH